MIKSYFNSLMRDKRNGALDSIVKLFLYMLSLPYLAVIRLWEFGYDSGILKSHKVPGKVISVGNITVGGTGKTPCVIFLAEKFLKHGKKVVVLSRGYGNDEWEMIEKKLGSVPVIRGRDRLKGACLAGRLWKPDVIILDDGYQQRRIRKDIDILLIDASNPFGNGKIFPRGILREPLSAVRKNSLIILTKTDSPASDPGLLEKIISWGFKKDDILESTYIPVDFTDVKTGEKSALQIVKGRKIAALSGIADADYFKHKLKMLGAEIIMDFDYPDHFNFMREDIMDADNKAKEAGCELVAVTEKDAVKLKSLCRGLAGLKFLAMKINFQLTKDSEMLLDKIS